MPDELAQQIRDQQMSEFLYRSQVVGQGAVPGPHPGGYSGGRVPVLKACG